MFIFCCMQELKQYPTLRVEVGNAATESLDRMRDESKKATLQLVEMECGYLTVEYFRKLPQDIEKGGNPTHSIFDRYNDSYLRRIGKWLLWEICIKFFIKFPKLKDWFKLVQFQTISSGLAGLSGLEE